MVFTHYKGWLNLCRSVGALLFPAFPAPLLPHRDGGMYLIGVIQASLPSKKTKFDLPTGL